MTYKSSNAFGWPKIHFSVYGRDMFGYDIIQGYGFTHVPSTPGRCVHSLMRLQPSCGRSFRYGLWYLVLCEMERALAWVLGRWESIQAHVSISLCVAGCKRLPWG